MAWTKLLVLLILILVQHDVLVTTVANIKMLEVHGSVATLP